MSSSINLLADVPANDRLAAPQAPIIVLMAVFGGLGYGTSRGVVPLWIAAASAIVNGLQFHITPKAAWKAYGADGKGVSEEAVVWTRLIGWSIVLRGIYMGSLILGATRKDAFGYTFVAAALNGLRFALFDAETIGASKYSRIYFVAFPLLVAAASFATLEPSELLSP